MTATGGDGGGAFGGIGFVGGPGGTATTTGIATALGSGAAIANATAAGGNAGGSNEFEGMSGGGAVSHSSARSSFGGAASVANATGGSAGFSDDLGAGGLGGDATATSTTMSGGVGGAASMAIATGGAGGGGAFHPGGAGGAATADSDSNSGGTGNATSTAEATGGPGGDGLMGGAGGNAIATANATASGSGTALATAVATAGAGGAGPFPGMLGAANATSTAQTTNGALAQAQSTAVGSSGQAQSTAKTSFVSVSVQSTAVAPTGSTATSNAIAQGGTGQAFANPGQTAYAFSTALPNKAYATSLIGGASNVASALLGPRDQVFGAAIVGANTAADGGGESNTYSATSTFDFGYGGDLELGLIDNQENGFDGGAGFQSMEFTIEANGVEILDTTFRSLSIAESFFHDDVIDLGADLGPNFDLTFGYTLVADGPGGFGFDFAFGGAVPESSTWAMMLAGFAGLGFMGWRKRAAWAVSCELSAPPGPEHRSIAARSARGHRHVRAKHSIHAN